MSKLPSSSRTRGTKRMPLCVVNNRTPPENLKYNDDDDVGKVIYARYTYNGERQKIKIKKTSPFNAILFSGTDDIDLSEYVIVYARNMTFVTSIISNVCILSGLTYLRGAGMINGFFKPSKSLTKKKKKKFHYNRIRLLRLLLFIVKVLMYCCNNFKLARDVQLRCNRSEFKTDFQSFYNFTIFIYVYIKFHRRMTIIFPYTQKS